MNVFRVFRRHSWVESGRSGHVEVLGVYRLRVTDELIREQFEYRYPCPMSDSERRQAEQQVRDQLSSVILVEAIVRDRDDRFDVSQFTQPQDGISEGYWQCAWAEAYLTDDGKRLLVERWADPPKEGDLRLAFFLHSWQPSRPLRTSYGDVACPAVKKMPDRLARIVPYEPVD